MITVHTTQLRHFQMVVDHCPTPSIRVDNYVDDVWAVIYPPTGNGNCPVVTFEGQREDAERVLGPIVSALRRGDARAALDAALAAADENVVEAQAPAPRF